EISKMESLQVHGRRPAACLAPHLYGCVLRQGTLPHLPHLEYRRLRYKLLHSAASEKVRTRRVRPAILQDARMVVHRAPEGRQAVVSYHNTGGSMTPEFSPRCRLCGGCGPNLNSGGFMTSELPWGTLKDKVASAATDLPTRY